MSSSIIVNVKARPADGPPILSESMLTSIPSGSSTVVVSMGRKPMMVRGGSSPGARIVSISPDIGSPARSNSTSIISPGFTPASAGARSSMMEMSVPLTFFNSSPGSSNSSAGLNSTHSVRASLASKQSRKSMITSPGCSSTG